MHCPCRNPLSQHVLERVDFCVVLTHKDCTWPDNLALNFLHVRAEWLQEDRPANSLEPDKETAYSIGM
eukprot:1384359-Rhodomonas_salina.2